MFKVKIIYTVNEIKYHKMLFTIKFSHLKSFIGMHYLKVNKLTIHVNQLQY